MLKLILKNVFWKKKQHIKDSWLCFTI